MKLADHQQVLEFMNKLEHPLKEEIQEVRNIILNVNYPITEHIKWNAPSYRMEKEDRITFNLQGKGFFRLVFHCGAKAKDSIDVRHLFGNTVEILEWVTDDRAIVKFTSMEDVRTKEKELVKAMAKWLEILGP